MKILVTGGAGFIGSNFIFHMLKKNKGHQIICLDRLTYAGNLSNLSSVMDHSDFYFVRGDICDQRTIDYLFDKERPEIVVNFAAETHVDRSIEAPGVFLRSNVQGTGVLLDACRKYEVRRFHQVSTDEVYGDLPLDRPELRFTETSPLRPSSPYSASKAGADLLVLAYHRTYGLNVTINRCSNNYGPRQFPEKLIPRFIVLALENQSLPLYGRGLNIRDWIYVEDHCEAISVILEKGRAGEVYNVGGGQEVQNLEVARQLCQALNRPERLITYVPDRKGHDLRYAVDAGKIAEQLGWKPKIAFANGLRRTAAWYLDHQDWWKYILSGAYQKQNEQLYRDVR